MPKGVPVFALSEAKATYSQSLILIPPRLNLDSQRKQVEVAVVAVAAK